MHPFLVEMLAQSCVLPSNDTVFQAQCDKMYQNHIKREELLQAKSAKYRGNMALKTADELKTAEERIQDKMEQADREGRLFG